MSRADADSTELAASPGSRLRHAREAQGLSEQQAAEALNLDPVVVTVLEANDFAALGAPVFVRGHLRRYAGLLGLPEDELLAAYEGSKQHIEEPTLVPRARLEMEPVRGRPRWPWVVGGAVAFLLAAFLVAWLSEHGLPGVAPASDDNPPDMPAASADSGQPGTATDRPSVDDASSGASATTPLASPVTASDANATALPAQVAPSDTTNANRAPAARSTTTTPVVPPATTPAPPGRVSLQLKFRADSWVEIFDGSGKAIVYDLAKAGSERTVTATPPLSVTLGNPTAVGMVVNGRGVAPPRPADGGAMARFRIAGDGSVH